MRVLFLAPLLAIGYAAYSKPVHDDYEDYGGGGGYGGPAQGQRNPVKPQFNAPAPASHGGGGGGHGGGHSGGHGGDYDQGYDVAEEWKPYSFSYSAQDTDGSHSHQQQADSKNRVTGQYSIMMADGRMRIVKYVADENGFRAEIVTNEQGTESKNPADVQIQSSAQTGEEAAKEYGNPQNNNGYGNYAAAPQQGPPSAPYSGGAAPHSAPHSAPPPPPTRSSYSNSQSYSKKNSQGYSQHNNQGYSHGQQDHHSTGYSQSRGYNQDSQYGAAPAPQPFPRHSGGSYGNDVSDIEDHEDQGYYSGAGPKNQRKQPSSYGR